MPLLVGTRRALLGRGGAVASTVLVSPESLLPFLGYAARLETPVTDNTALAQLTDQSGNGRHATQATGTKQLKYRTNAVNSLPAFEGDGVDDGYQTAAIDLSHTPAITVVGVALGPAGTRTILELSSDYTANVGSFAVLSEGNTFTSYHRGNVATVGQAGNLNWAGGYHVFAVTIDMSRVRDETALFVDGMFQSNTSSSNNTGNFGSSFALNVFARNAGTSRAWLGRASEVWLYDYALSPAELADVTAYLGGLYALPYGIRYEITDARLWDNAYAAEPWSSHHHLVADTDATRIHYEATSTIFSAGLGVEGEASIRQANHDHFVGNLNADMLTYFGANNLVAGSKRVEIVGGLVTRVNGTGTPKGTFVRAVTFPSTAAVTFPAESGDLWVVYGDSIAVGDDAGGSSVGGWAMRLRRELQAQGKRLRVEGWGYRTLYEDSLDHANLITRLTDGSPAVIVLAIGVNDYQLARPSILPAAWTDTTFQAEYALLLDDLHAALPSATIYCVTPIGRVNETSPVNGDTLPNYRTAISNAQSTRSAYATLIDGTTLLNYNAPDSATAEYEGTGVHPNDRGHHTLFGRLARAIDLGLWQYDSMTGRWSAKNVMTTALTLADAGVVSRVEDIAGRKNHALQATGAAQPKFYTGQTPAFGPAVRVDGGDGLATAAIDLTGTNGLTLYWLGKLVSGDTGILAELGADYAAITTGFQLKHNAGNTITAALVGDVGASDFTTTATVTGYALITAVFDKGAASNEVTVYVNGAAAAGTRTNNSNNTNAFGSLALNLLARNNAASGWMANLSELADCILSNTADGTSQRQAIEQALCAEHGLTWAG